MKPSAVTKRLLPLYIGALLQSVVFWYAIEKLFMTQIGFTPLTIGLMVAVMSAVIVLIETPSGILADRWSRKGVMILGCVGLLLSAVIGGLSNGVTMYIVSTCLWGVYNAFYSGTYESVIYDTVLEETGSSSTYDRQLSMLRMIEGFGFVTGAVVGGLIATADIRATYFVSIPFIMLGIICLLLLREPKIHKAETESALWSHVVRTFQAILTRRAVLPVLIAIIGFAVIQDTLFELSQLWYLALLLPVGLYGVASASLFSTWSVGGLLQTTLQRRWARYIGLGLIMIAAILLCVSRNYILTIVAQFVLGSILVAYGISLSRMLHDTLPSSIRAGSASVVSTLGRIVIIPGSLLFGAVSQKSSVFTASYGFVGVLLIAAIAYIYALKVATRSAPAAYHGQ